MHPVRFRSSAAAAAQPADAVAAVSTGAPCAAHSKNTVGVVLQLACVPGDASTATRRGPKRVGVGVGPRTNQTGSGAAEKNSKARAATQG